MCSVNYGITTRLLCGGGEGGEGGNRLWARKKIIDTMLLYLIIIVVRALANFKNIANFNLSASQEF